MHIRHILFDLDGTLLPMNQDEFVTFYMPLLAKKYISEGISFDPKAFIASVWKGYGAMVNNDGSCTNREAFWQYMDELLPTDSENSERIALDFYANEFNQAIAVTQPNSLSDKVVKKAKEKEGHVINGWKVLEVLPEKRSGKKESSPTLQPIRYFQRWQR